ncbi:MAG: DsbA family protein [Proteobacteria bacterium]|nr:DsbA family protein [Pseudomonadota bacterium]
MVERVWGFGRLAGAALGLCASFATIAAEEAPIPDKTVIATINSDKVTAAQIVASQPQGFDRLKQDREHQLRQVANQYSSGYHELVSNELGRYLDQRVLQLEAKAHGTTPEALLEQETQVPEVSDADVRALYEARKSQINKPYEKVADEIRKYIARQRKDQAARAFYDSLRKKYGVTIHVEPYRAEVASTGPVRGKPGAPVTIVEFGDFQCPYCHEAEGSLKAVLAKYPDQVRLIFREMPLADLHENALQAARAGLCAERQGKFWEMHDAMFADQSKLDADGLRHTAERLGLDMPQYEKCFANVAQTAQILLQDGQEATDVGVNSTPSFFINGRPLRGSVPPEEFSAIIDDELSRTPRHNNGHP